MSIIPILRLYIQPTLHYMEYDCSPHSFLLLRWCTGCLFRAFHFQRRNLNIWSWTVSSWSHVQLPHTQTFLSCVFMVLPLNCSSPLDWFDTTAHHLPAGISSSSWTFDCSKSRCQPSDEGTYTPYHTVLCCHGNNILYTVLVVYMWHCSGWSLRTPVEVLYA